MIAAEQGWVVIQRSRGWLRFAVIDADSPSQPVVAGWFRRKASAQRWVERHSYEVLRPSTPPETDDT